MPWFFQNKLLEKQQSQKQQQLSFLENRLIHFMLVGSCLGLFLASGNFIQF